MLLVLQKCRQSFKALFCLSVFFVLRYAASIFDLEIFIRRFLQLCITPDFKLILNISAKILADRMNKGQQVCHITVICWTYLSELPTE